VGKAMAEKSLGRKERERKGKKEKNSCLNAGRGMVGYLTKEVLGGKSVGGKRR